MKKSNGIIAYTIIIAIVIALIFFFQRSLYTQTNVTYSQYRSFVEEEKSLRHRLNKCKGADGQCVVFCQWFIDRISCIRIRC